MGYKKNLIFASILAPFFFKQLRPSFHPEGLLTESKTTESNPNRITQMWHLNGKCPENTIPIRRTKREDVLRASSIKTFGRKKHRTVPNPQSADPDLINESGHQVRDCKGISFELKSSAFCLYCYWVLIICLFCLCVLSSMQLLM